MSIIRESYAIMRNATLLLLITALFPSWLTGANAAERPNFVVIMADDMGYGDASCYGGTAYKTPHLDALAKRGMRFTDFHSACPVCSPTRAALVTGRYQQRAGIPGVVYAAPDRNRHHGLHTHEVTFAELLSKAGYATGIFGKWHLGYRPKFNPVHHGFDRFRGYVSGNVDYISHRDQTGVHDWWDGLKDAPEKGYSTHLITKHAVQFIENNKSRPFCVYVPHEAPHYPYQGPNDKPDRLPGKKKWDQLGSRADRKAAYAIMMREMDKGIGEIVATLERLNLTDNTLVLFTSDNGAIPVGSNGSLHGHKGSLWEGGHRVPTVAVWPGQIPPGSISHQTAMSIDIMPTLLDFAAVQPPTDHKFDGQSLRNVLTKNERLPERTLFWEYRNGAAVRQGPWKLVLGQKGQKQPGLYHLGEDPSETKNLATNHPGRVTSMQQALEAWRKDVANGATVQPGK
jgi:arylsulfatase A